MACELPEYNAVQALLMNHKIPVTVAELQGMLLGLYAAGMATEDPEWLQQMYALTSQSAAQQQILHEPLNMIHDHLIQALENHEIGLQLLLPDDDEFIVDRAEAMIYWAQGFLLGFQAKQATNSISDDTATEAFDDIQQIALLDLDSISEQETDEKDLYALQEHLKVSAMIIHQTQSSEQNTTPHTLH